jgi:hypothetical protein
LPGLQLYQHYGFEALDRTEVALPDGVTVDCVSMAMPIRDAS